MNPNLSFRRLCILAALKAHGPLQEGEDINLAAKDIIILADRVAYWAERSYMTEEWTWFEGDELEDEG